jgi:hypothetical protein
MPFQQPAPDPRKVRLAEHVGVDLDHTVDIGGECVAGEPVRVTATLVFEVPYDEFVAVWNGTDTPRGHLSVVTDIPHPGPGPIGCPYCIATLQLPVAQGMKLT